MHRSHPDDVAIVRVAGLHALSYCERLYYLEEVEEIRLADESVYAGRALHTRLSETEKGHRKFSLRSEKLRLVGQVDAVHHRSGAWIPYEHKRGRARRKPDGTLEAWPWDALQVLAYATLIEEVTGKRVPEGRIRYHADNVTVRIPLTEEGKNWCVQVSRGRFNSAWKDSGRQLISTSTLASIALLRLHVCLRKRDFFPLLSGNR